MEGDAQSGQREHRQVVGAVAHGDGLCQIHLLHLGDEAQQLGLACAVHDVAHVASRQFAVFAHLQLVGIDVVDAELLLQIFAEKGESAGEDGNLVAVFLQHQHQALGPFGDGQVFGDVLHHGDIQPLEQRHAFGERLLEVDLAAHGSGRDGGHLVAHAVTGGQFVDAFGLNQRGVHIEADEAAHAAIHVVLLERAVHRHLAAHLEQFALHHVAVARRAAQGELNAGLVACGVGVFGVFGQRRTSGETPDGVDVESLLGDDFRHGFQLLGREASAQHGEDVAVLALTSHPGVVVFVGDGEEAHVDAQLRRLEQHVLHQRTAVLLVHADKQSEGERLVDVGLSDVHDVGVVLGEYAHDACSESGPVFAGDSDENEFLSHDARF